MATIDNDWSEAERREYERYGADFHLAVLEPNNDAPLGQLVDISMGGMRLLSERPIATGAQLELILDIALESGRAEKVALQAESVWGKEDDNPGFYQTGFRFLNLSRAATEAVEAIIQELM
jgi:c-di-GMP-binding flagellar brake protein YcgR